MEELTLSLQPEKYRMTRKWLESKTVFLTGASSGIGRELTKLLIQLCGCKVIGVGLNEEKMRSLCVAMGEQSALFEYRLFDVSKRENWQACVLDLEHRRSLTWRARLLDRIFSLRSLVLFTCILKKAKAELFADVFRR